MDSIPSELLVESFNYLDLDEIKKLRLVCKKFKSIVDNLLRREDLVISGARVLSSNRWSHDDKLISHLNWIKDLDAPGFKSSNNLFKTIKHLYIETGFNYETNDNILRFQLSNFPSNLLKNINSFQHLETFEIISSNYLGETGELKINLPKLKVFNIGLTKLRTIKLNTPKLVYLKTKRLALSKIQVMHPQTIKHLEIDDYDSTVMTFKNLEYLYCYRFSTLEPELIVKLTKLKQIHFMEDRKLLPQFKKLKLKKSDLNVYFYGMNVSRIDPPAKISFSTSLYDKDLMYLVDNCDSLADKLPYFTELPYCKLENKKINGYDFVQDDILKKFNRLTVLNVQSAVSNRGLLTSLLACCKNLQKLKLSYSADLSAKFFNNIPDHQPNLEYLSFEARKRSLKLNLDTVFKLKRLLVLDINKRFKREELRDFCERLFKETKVRNFGFYYKHSNCEINYEGGLFSIQIEHTDDDEKCDNLDDLFGWIDGGCEEMFDHFAYKRRRDLGPSSDESKNN